MDANRGLRHEAIEPQLSNMDTGELQPVLICDTYMEKLAPERAPVRFESADSPVKLRGAGRELP